MRTGGVSQGPFDSLNFSISVGDSPENVEQNLAIAARHLGVDRSRILFLDQVHGTIIRVFNAQTSHEQAHALEGDAVASRDPLVACAVRNADCAPVLLADRASGAVVAVHSGWKGTQQNIVAEAVRWLRSQNDKADVVAAVGPHIEACCFEVGPEVAEALAKASAAPDVSRMGPRGRPHVDLRAILHAQLLDAGVRPDAIDHVRGCTVCDADRFFSYRRDGQRSGRMLSAIVPRGQWSRALSCFSPAPNAAPRPN